MNARHGMLLGFALGLSMAVVSGCNPTTAASCSSTCAGCCDADSKCQAGTSLTGCGVSGATCATCSTTQVCAAGQCVASGGSGGSTGGAGGSTGGAGGSTGGAGGSTGGSGGSTGGSGGAGGTGGITWSPDAGDITCGTAGNCAAPNVCCVDASDGGLAFSCAASCTTGATASCDGPEDCTTGAPTCCGNIDLDGGTLPRCNFGSMGAACASSCTTSIPFSCTAAATVRFCHQSAYCATDNNNPVCCTFNRGTASASFCVSTLLSAGASSCN